MVKTIIKELKVALKLKIKKAEQHWKFNVEIGTLVSVVG